MEALGLRRGLLWYKRLFGKVVLVNKVVVLALNHHGIRGNLFGGSNIAEQMYSMNGALEMLGLADTIERVIKGKDF